MTTAYIGLPISRVDGHAKVTGAAKYAAEHNVPNLAYGYVVSSAIAKGAIIRIDAADARRLPGVLQVLTHENVPRLPGSDRGVRDDASSPGVPFIPLKDNQVRFSLAKTSQAQVPKKAAAVKPPMSRRSASSGRAWKN